ncbi:MAG: hypothetical protein Q4B82_01085 [Alysiella sp.]|uniref:hypothetical protein n=1 Tax=Alysiella sp. TaxID=1872483 RepID=UPI0026DBE6A9|nr:hypothetical protein [Alysiella sp.]MDO4433162.1 hypothetical protein [Alysiella sp.]
MKKSYPLDKMAVKNKLKAAAWHFVFSVLVFVLALVWIRWFLYPDFHFDLNGVWYGLRLVAGVDLVLGPLITFLVFHHAKPLREKIMDFTLIGLVQAAALFYGLYTMYQEHPRMLTLYQYGTAMTITQREYATDKMVLPADLSQFSQVGHVPVVFYQRTKEQQAVFSPLTLADLQLANQNVRHYMTYDDDKHILAELDKQYGENKVYVFAIMGKYQGAFVAMDAQLNVVRIFGQRDLH